MVPFFRGWHWKGRVLTCVEGVLVQRMRARIASTQAHYPWRHTYALTGPNSNTYTQWVLDHFPEAGIASPTNTWGKHWNTAQEEEEKKDRHIMPIPCSFASE